MADVNIFDDENKVTGVWFKPKLGESIQGTFVNKRQKPNSYKPEEKQWIYELRDKDGTIHIIGGKPGVDVQMKHLKLGQIVGIKYIKDEPNRDPKLSPTKKYQVYANPNVIDEEWLKEREDAGMSEDMSEAPAGTIQEPTETSTTTPEEEDEDEIKVNEIPFDDTVDPKKQAIYDLATSKLRVKADADAPTKEKKIMESTGLAFIDGNLDKIKEKLESM